MELQRLYSLVRQAMQKYNMVQDGDRIAIGISGGKDSLGLLYGLAGLRRFYPKHFELVAITVDLGYEGFDLKDIGDLCGNLDVPFHIVKTEIAKMITKDGCSLCARLRKGALLNQAKALGCNKIAYAHNKDDCVETMMMSLIYEGRFCSFWPVTRFEDTDIAVIRPFMYVSQADAIGFANKYQLPVTSNPCPFDHTSERSYIRNLLKEIEHHAPGARKRMMTAIEAADIFPPIE